jgi:hypothetical protein
LIGVNYVLNSEDSAKSLDGTKQNPLVVGSVSPIYLGNNSLEPKPLQREGKQFEFTVGTGSVSETSPFKPETSRSRPRPIITAGAVGDSSLSRSIRPASEIQASPGAQVEEVQVQSAGLVIIPRKSRKLIILE